MNLLELEEKIKNSEERVNKLNAVLSTDSSPLNKNSYAEAKKELDKWNRLKKSATSYSADIKDPETAVLLYTTKQANLFLGLSRAAVRRIKKGYYAKYQGWLYNLLKSDSRLDRAKALDIMKIDTSKFKDIDVLSLKFEMIEEELDRRVWSF